MTTTTTKLMVASRSSFGKAPPPTALKLSFTESDPEREWAEDTGTTPLMTGSFSTECTLADIDAWLRRRWYRATDLTPNSKSTFTIQSALTAVPPPSIRQKTLP